MGTTGGECRFFQQIVFCIHSKSSNLGYWRTFCEPGERQRSLCSSARDEKVRAALLLGVPKLAQSIIQILVYPIEIGRRPIDTNALII